MRNEAYLDWVRSLPCACCGSRFRVQAHHLIALGDGKMGGKAPDIMAVPLCYTCHELLHRTADMGMTSAQVRWLRKTLVAALQAGVLRIVPEAA